MYVRLIVDIFRMRHAVLCKAASPRRLTQRTKLRDSLADGRRFGVLYYP